MDHYRIAVNACRIAQSKRSATQACVRMALIIQLEQLLLAYPKTSALVLLAVGALGPHLWTRFRKRTAVLFWTATHMRHAASGDHPSVGEIEVLVNGTRARALYFSNVTLRNPTIHDFTNLEIDFELPVGTTIVADEGKIASDIRNLVWSESYVASSAAARAAWAEPSPTNAELRAKVSRCRAYKVPDFNRLSTASFTFLWENSQTVQQVIDVSCVKAGLKFVFKKNPTASILGVDQNRAAIIGLCISIIAVLLLVPNQWTVYAAFLIGIGVKLVGTTAIKGWELLIRTLS